MAKDDESYRSSLDAILGRSRHKLEHYQSEWNLVDSFTIHQAAFLWCGYEPIPELSLGLGQVEPKSYRAILQMLIATVQTDEANKVFTQFVSGSSTISRDRLVQLAEVKKAYPSFLFDTVAEAVNDSDAEDDDQQEPAKRGRPSEYNWNLMLAEIIRYAALNDLPGNQAELIRYLENWFRNGMSNTPSAKDYGSPSEPNLKRRVSTIYKDLKKVGWKPAGS